MSEHEALHFSGLILKYLKKELSSEEEQHFLRMIASDPQKKELLNHYKSSEAFQESLDYMQNLDTQKAWSEVSAKMNRGKTAAKVPVIRNWVKYAAILVVATTIGLLWFNLKPDDGVISENSFGFKNDVLPGIDQALLVLGNGQKIHLDTSAHIIEEAGSAGPKTRDGEINYAHMVQGRNQTYNEIRVPANGKYRLVLSDGTKVWMNSSSVIKFPVNFSGKERRVFLEGEAFFDVSKDAERPFYVEAREHTIQVLGTRFNVFAYQNDVKTSLVEGSVKIADKRDTKILKPGEEAISGISGIKIKPANLEKATAWKQGYFVFDQDNIHTVLDQLSRWYNVEIHYEGDASKDLYSGSMPRSSTLGAVLQMLMDVSTLKFEIDGRDLTVTNASK